MYKSEREQQILLELEKNHYVTVEYLAKKLFISESSIRRDLAYLEAQGQLKRSYGGAEQVVPNKSGPFRLRRHKNEQEKKRIAKAAATLIAPGDVVFLDGSSSAFFVAEHLAQIKNITVITPGIDTLFLLSQYQIKTICTGGLVSRENPSELVGEIARETLGKIHANVSFVSAFGLSDDGEITDSFQDEIPLRQLMVKRSDRAVFLCDGSKVFSHSVFHQGSIDEFSAVVSDVSFPDEFCEKFPDVDFITAKR